MSAFETIVRVSRDSTVRSLMSSLGLTEALTEEVTDLAINRPGEFWLETFRGWERVENLLLTFEKCQSLATAIAVYNKSRLDADNPSGSFILPDGERCQIIMPPVTQVGKIIFSIRKPSSDRFSLDDYQASGRLSPKSETLNSELLPFERELVALKDSFKYKEFFELAVENKLNIVTVGGTGSGKTTFTKTLIDLYPAHARMFIIENVHELTTPKHRNSVHMLFDTQFDAKKVLASCMRLKPDHIFITELLGDETWDYLMALQSGHSGSITSVHANDCRGALFKIASYVKQSNVGRTLEMDFIMKEVYSTIDVVISFNRTYLDKIYYDPQRKLELLMHG